MASLKMGHSRLSVIIFLIFLCFETKAKLSENKTNLNQSGEEKSSPKKTSEGPALLFADEFKQTLERYLFGMCPQTYKMSLGKKNATSLACDVDASQQDLPGRLAALALRAHTASRSDCARLGAALANTLGELARTAANRQVYNNAAAAAAASEAKKRKLSKSQKMKIQAKQRTALAVKKKAAAVAAAAAAKISS